MPSPRPRRHDTFAVLRRARAAVHDADLVLDRAQEAVLHAASRRRGHAAHAAHPVLDETTVTTLRQLLG